MKVNFLTKSGDAIVIANFILIFIKQNRNNLQEVQLRILEMF